MGCPLGPTLANIFLTSYKDRWLDNCPIHFRPRHYRRYVDDVFLMFKCKDQVKKSLRYMNSRHPNIQFTCEEESSSKISFLDVFITRMNCKLVASLYRKKVFSGVYMNNNSFLHLKYKKGLIYTLLLRAFNICADYNRCHNEVQYLKLIWQKSYFPLSFFIDSCIKRFLAKTFITYKTSDSVSDKKEIFICLEFLGKLLFQSKKQLNEIFRKQKNIKVNVVFKSSNRIRNAFRSKDIIHEFESSLQIQVQHLQSCLRRLNKTSPSGQPT